MIDPNDLEMRLKLAEYRAEEGWDLAAYWLNESRKLTEDKKAAPATIEDLEAKLAIAIDALEDCQEELDYLADTTPNGYFDHAAREALKKIKDDMYVTTVKDNKRNTERNLP